MCLVQMQDCQTTNAISTNTGLPNDKLTNANIIIQETTSDNPWFHFIEVGCLTNMTDEANS